MRLADTWIQLNDNVLLMSDLNKYDADTVNSFYFIHAL